MQLYPCTFCSILLCAVLFFFSISDVVNCYADGKPDVMPEVSIEMQVLRFAWNRRQVNPLIWDVKSGTKEEETEWFSLLSSPQDDGHINRHFNVQGVLNDRTIPEEGPVSIQRVNQSNTNPEIYVSRHIFEDNLKIEHVYTFNKSSYSFLFSLRLHNQSDTVYKISPTDYIAIVIGPGLGDQRSYGLGYADTIYSFVEPVAVLNGKIKRYRDLMLEVLSNSETQWVGLHGRYFALLLAGTPNNKFDLPMERAIISWESKAHLPKIAIQLPLQNIPPGAFLNWEFLVFSGPKSNKALRDHSLVFEQIIFPGLWQWMRWLCFGLQWFLAKIYAFIPNWGIAIILLAVFIRITMYPISMNVLAKQHEFVDLQKRMQPELSAIKRDFKGEEQSERILKLYKKYAISPLAGLKPLLLVIIQLPILMALFHTLGSTYELRTAPFLWINTLALPDKLFHFGFAFPVLGEYFNLLPILMALSTLLTIKLSPAPATDITAKKRQNLFLLAMAFGFMVVFYPFPSGVVLYWTVANLLHILQQKWASKVVLHKK